MPFNTTPPPPKYDTTSMDATAIADLIQSAFVANGIIPSNDTQSSSLFKQLAINIPQGAMNDFDFVAGYINNTPSFKPLADKIAVKFKGIADFKKNFPGVPAPSYAEYMSSINSYNQILGTNNANGLASNDFYATLIGNGISPNEFQNRMDIAKNRVENADDSLKKQLLASYPGATLSDIAHSMLLGKDQGSEYLKKFMSRAETRAAFDSVGLSPFDENDIANSNMSYDQLKSGAQDIANNSATAKKLSAIYGQDLTQNEMEKEVFKGMASQRRAKLNNLEQSAFNGVSGVGSTSLSSRRAGQI